MPVGCPLFPRKRTLRDSFRMSAKCQKRTSRASIAKPLSPRLVPKPRGAVYSPLGFQSPLRCGLGRKSGTQEGQQVGIYRVCLGGWAAVREALVGL